MKIVICASEVIPFAKTGGLADVAGALPLELKSLGQEVVVVMPCYKAIQEPKFLPAARLPDGQGQASKLEKVRKDISCAIAGKDLKVYFIENDAYFNRDGLYGDKSGDYPDNLDRFSYYCRRTLEFLKEINFKADIVHCHDWQSALIPVYLKTLYKEDPFYKSTKTILTIHNIGYQGLFAKEEFPKLGLDWSLFNIEMLEFYGKINVLKGGIVFADLINTVSPTYSKEIQTSEFGFGLEGILNKRRQSLSGILNGLDYSIWDPKKDKFIARNYSLKNLEDKYENKKDLQKLCGLPLKKDIPLFGIVSRLAEQKGFDILSQDIEKICRMQIQMVILGTGDLKYHEILQDIAGRYPEVISLHLKFDDSLAHKIYAGSDIFLMPSKYEPCGLGQLISMSYGTVPLVFKTGGLADTVNAGNGFVFNKYTEDDLVRTIQKAVEAFGDKKKWAKTVENGMKGNFSWNESAKKYLQLYEKAKKTG